MLAVLGSDLYCLKAIVKCMIIEKSNLFIEESLKLSSLNYIDKNHYKNRFGQLLENLRLELIHLNYEEKLIIDSQYALVAFVDEQILKSKIENRYDWQGEQLQLIYFNDTLAGEHFFHKLRSYMTDQSDKCLDVVELYYMILLLGFTGVYIMIPDERKQFINDVKNWLELHGRLNPGPLSPHGIDSDSYQLKSKKKVIPKQWVNTIIIMIALLMSLHVVYTLILYFMYSDLNTMLLR